MTSDLVVLDGSTFFVSDEAGDVRDGGPTGFFFQDVRHLSRWALSVNGAPMRVLTSRVVDYYSGRVFGTLPTARLGHNPPISLQRDRIVGGGVHGDLWIRNHSEVTQELILELEVDSDFADIFELKLPDRLRVGSTTVESGDGALTIWHERHGVRRGTRVVWHAPGRFTNGAIQFEITLAPRGEWEACLDISCIVDGQEYGPREGHGGFGKLEPQMPRTLQAWLADAPTLETDSDLVQHTYRRSLVDLAALRFRPSADLTWSLPGGRSAVVHGPVRSGQPDHRLHGAPLPAATPATTRSNTTTERSGHTTRRSLPKGFADTAFATTRAASHGRCSRPPTPSSTGSRRSSPVTTVVRQRSPSSTPPRLARRRGLQRHPSSRSGRSSDSNRKAAG